MGHVASMG